MSRPTSSLVSRIAACRSVSPASTWPLVPVVMMSAGREGVRAVRAVKGEGGPGTARRGSNRVGGRDPGASSPWKGDLSCPSPGRCAGATDALGLRPCPQDEKDVQGVAERVAARQLRRRTPRCRRMSSNLPRRRRTDKAGDSGPAVGVLDPVGRGVHQRGSKHGNRRSTRRRVLDCAHRGSHKAEGATTQENGAFGGAGDTLSS